MTTPSHRRARPRIVILAALLLASPAAADVIHVNAAAPDGGDGQSWSTAFNDLQAALAVATSGDQLWIVAGTYRPAPPGGPRTATFMLVDGVVLYGGFAGFETDLDQRDPVANETILSGDLLSSWSSDCCEAHDSSGCDDPICMQAVCAIIPDCCQIEWSDSCAEYAAALCNDLCDASQLLPVYHVVTSIDAGPGTLLDGFHVTDGLANAPSAMVEARRGAGLYVRDSSLSLVRLTISGNVARGAGAGLYAADSVITVDACSFESNAMEFSGAGAGLFCVRSQLTMANCSFVGNSAYYGGAMCIVCECSVSVIDSVFTGNTAGISGGALATSWCPYQVMFLGCTFAENSAGADGGAIYTDGPDDIVVEDCLFIGNSAGGIGGAGRILGHLRDSVFIGNTADWAGAVMMSRGSITGCTFIGNTAPVFGAVYLIQQADYGNIEVDGSLFLSNVASDGGAGGLSHQGYIVTPASQTTVSNCAFIGNTGVDAGGIFNYYRGRLRVSNCTMRANHVLQEGRPGGILSDAMYGGAPLTNTEIRNCVVWQNTNPAGQDESAQIGVVASALLSIGNTNVQGWTGAFGGVGNFGDDPLFIDPLGPDAIPGTEDDDLRLAPGSPCIDAGFNNAVPLDSLDLDGDGVTGEFIPFDLDGLPRFAADPDAPDTGCGVGAIVDIGAYEFQGVPAAVVYADLTGDGLVDMADLMLLLAAWGACPTEPPTPRGPPTCCLPDLDADGAVNIIDLLALLAHWG